MSDPSAMNRRCFVRAVASTGASLVLACRLPDPARPPGRRAEPPPGSFAPNVHLRIDPDGTVSITVAETEMGQGVRTSLPMIVAEELEVDWPRIRVTQASPGPGLPDLGTGGSWSIGGNWKALREAGATARAMLIAAAAAEWRVDPAECRAERGAVLHERTGRRLDYGELTAAAAKLPVPSAVSLKSPGDYRLIGRRIPRIDGRPIATGAAVYGIDVRVPGMRFAAVERPPVAGAEPLRWDRDAAAAVAGVRAVLPISTGIAVVAASTWAAVRGREALRVTWKSAAGPAFDGDEFRRRLARAARAGGVVTRREGRGADALAGATDRLDALYEYPFQAHAPVEPMNCTADARPGRCEIWAPTQAPSAVRAQVARRLGLAPEAVTVHVTLTGGGFGRRLGTDYAVEAAELAAALQGPVQVLWSRQDDFRHGHLQPASAHWMRGGLDERGAPIAWTHTKAGTYLSVLESPGDKEKSDPAYLRDSSWGCYDIPYGIPSIETSHAMLDAPVATGPWRAVYSPSCTFARECFLDEMAHAAGADPLRFRLELLEPGRVVQAGSLRLDQGRLRRVLQIAAERAGWGAPLPPGRGRGLACNIYDGDTCLAYVAEVSVERGRIRVDRVVCAVDCGIAVNPGGVEAQVEGGVAFGLSTALGSEVTFRDGRVAESSYRDYRVVTMPDMPVVETHIVASEASPTGMGEPPVPPIAPAVANAVFAATGRRLRRLPLAL